jgi:predicted permease
MAIVDIALPLLIVMIALACAVLIWLLGTFTFLLRNCRYRVALGMAAFSVSGLMGFCCTLKMEINVLSDWLAAQPPSWTMGIAYIGYLFFGFLGCWTAVRLGGPLDRRHTLSTLYSLLEDRKKQDTQ